MTTQARPKYTVEEYPLVFVYDSNVTDTPTFSIELLSGIDPVKEAMLGPAVVYKNLVALFVYGGVAGCIYQISCVADEIEKTARIAVLPTAATAPSGGSFPFLHRVNSWPYPVIYRDEVSVSVGIVSGSMDVILVSSTLEDDSVDLGVSIVGGYLAYPPSGTLEDDSVDVSISILSGIMKESRKGYMQDDSIDLGMSITTGLMKPGPKGNARDNLDVSISIVGGSLYVP